MKTVEAVNLLVETANLLDSYSEIEKANALTKLAQDISNEWEGGAEFAKPYHGDEYLETEEENQYNNNRNDGDYEDALRNLHENIQEALIESKSFGEFENRMSDILITDYTEMIDIHDVKRMIDGAKERFLQTHPEELNSELQNVSFGDDLKRYLEELDVDVVDDATEKDFNDFEYERRNDFGV